MACSLTCVLTYSFYVAVLGIVAKVVTHFMTGRYTISKSLKGKVIVITGGTAGIGKETVRKLAERDATIHMLARDLNRAERVVNELKQSTGNSDLHIHRVDLNNFSTVRQFAEKFLATETPIHILINNAGLSTMTKRKTIDGNEETTQANHLGPFLLTNLLIERLIATGREDDPARIINLASVAHRFANANEFGDGRDINFEKTKWGPFKAYAWSKLMNILFTRELAKRLRGKPVTVNSAHPGGVRTELARDSPWQSPLTLSIYVLGPWLKTSLDGAQTTLYLTAADEVAHVTGEYFADCKPSSISLKAADDRVAGELWKESERLTNFQSKY